MKTYLDSIEELKQQDKIDAYREHNARMQLKHDGWTPQHESKAEPKMTTEQQERYDNMVTIVKNLFRDLDKLKEKYK